MIQLSAIRLSPMWCFILFCIVTAAMFVLERMTRPKGRHARYIKRAWRVYRKIQKHEMVDGQLIVYLRRINPYVFEELVLIAFSKKGYSIKRNTSYSGDGGVDGQMHKDGKEYYVQCKRYASYIQMNHVQEFAYKCHRDGRAGFFVHTGRTGPLLKRNPQSYGDVEIISGQRLIALMYEKKY